MVTLLEDREVSARVKKETQRGGVQTDRAVAPWLQARLDAPLAEGKGGSS